MTQSQQFPRLQIERLEFIDLDTLRWWAGSSAGSNPKQSDYWPIQDAEGNLEFIMVKKDGMFWYFDVKESGGYKLIATSRINLTIQKENAPVEAE